MYKRMRTVEEKKKRRRIIRIACFVIIAILSTGFINPLKTTTYNITNSLISKDFDGFTIVAISDFHLKSFGKKEAKLIKEIKDCNPDIIVFTGDMIDENHKNIDNLEYLLEGIHDLCPIYQVTGNHEKENMVFYSQMQDLYDKYGVIDMNDNKVYIERNGSKIFLAGIDYYGFPDYWDDFKAPADTFSILLYHNAEAFDETSKLGYNLVLSGHTHGGIIRLPFAGGLISTDVKLGANFEKGVYDLNGSTLISNTGLGAAPLPRYNNPREIVKIVLKSED